MGEEGLRAYRGVHRQTGRLFFLFSIFSVCGWVYEIALESAVASQFVNRGLLKGPYLPIYGFGLVLMLWVFSAVVSCEKSSAGKGRWGEAGIFLTVAAVASFMEYITSVIVEQTMGMKLWDYARYPLNLNGRICLMASIFFGLGGLFCLKVGFPWVLKTIKKIPERWQWIVASGISGIILVDFCCTATGIQF